VDVATFDKVHAFWFGPLAEFDSFPMDRFPIWFGGGEAVDADIAQRFSDALVAVADEPDSGTLSAQQEVGRVVLIDQMSRNIHRNRPDAYSLDHFARQVAREAIRAGLDRFRLVERVFVILPLGHSESLTDQDLALDLFLRDVAPFAPADNRFYQASRIQSQKYRDIIARFGRFPQRNAILGRTTTAEEAAFLADAKLIPF
jgi:uncharacterized protein (DUF924 family)